MIIFLKTHDYFQNINVSVLFFLRKYAYSISLVITDSIQLGTSYNRIS